MILCGTEVFVDRFYGGEGVVNPVFVLSHCHTDHLLGLSPKWRSISAQKIICSEETRRVIAIKMTGKENDRACVSSLFWGVKTGVWLRRGADGAKLVEGAPVIGCSWVSGGQRGDGGGGPQVGEEDTTFTLRIALLPSDHCVGSCMVLVESRDPLTGRVTRQLHTGDVARGPLTERSVALVRSLGPLPLDKLWFDSSNMDPRVHQLPDDEAVACALRIIRRHPGTPVRMLWKTFGDEKIAVMAARRLGALPIAVTEPYALRILEAAYGPGVFTSTGCAGVPLEPTSSTLSPRCPHFFALVNSAQLRELSARSCRLEAEEGVPESTLLQVRNRMVSPSQPSLVRGVWRIAWSYHACWDDLVWLVRSMGSREYAPFEARCSKWLPLFREVVGGAPLPVLEGQDAGLQISPVEAKSFLKPALIPGRIQEQHESSSSIKRPRLENLVDLVGVSLL